MEVAKPFWTNESCTSKSLQHLAMHPLRKDDEALIMSIVNAQGRTADSDQPLAAEAETCTWLPSVCSTGEPHARAVETRLADLYLLLACIPNGTLASTHISVAIKREKKISHWHYCGLVYCALCCPSSLTVVSTYK